VANVYQDSIEYLDDLNMQRVAPFKGVRTENFQSASPLSIILFLFYIISYLSSADAEDKVMVETNALIFLAMSKKRNDSSS